ncbi:hypothetical protein ACIQM3_07710 [Streptomyces sp. NPDC091271]|uniref:hypothetical protein n=1 Tax=Streptomyces sp. NPDC091271 TaxID=3365980 RepID=UPI0037F3DC6A
MKKRSTAGAPERVPKVDPAARRLFGEARHVTVYRHFRAKEDLVLVDQLALLRPRH